MVAIHEQRQMLSVDDDQRGSLLGFSSNTLEAFISAKMNELI